MSPSSQLCKGSSGLCNSPRSQRCLQPLCKITTINGQSVSIKMTMFVFPMISELRLGKNCSSWKTWPPYGLVSECSLHWLQIIFVDESKVHGWKVIVGKWGSSWLLLVPIIIVLGTRSQLTGKLSGTNELWFLSSWGWGTKCELGVININKASLFLWSSEPHVIAQVHVRDSTGQEVSLSYNTEVTIPRRSIGGTNPLHYSAFHSRPDSKVTLHQLSKKICFCLKEKNRGDLRVKLKRKGHCISFLSSCLLSQDSALSSVLVPNFPWGFDLLEKYLGL